MLVALVDVDPDRAPLLRWAFEQYATGDWTIEGLAQALRDKGLQSRGGPKQPSREIGFAALTKMLRNPYYMGIVTFQGVAYQGKHEPLVDAATWLRVQDVLATRAHGGEKERKHPHYLRSTIYCGHCGERLVYTQHHEQIELPPDEVERLRAAVRAELASQTADAHQHAEQANRRLAALGDERPKLMQAHYAGAIPLDLLKTEMDRLTRAVTSGELHQDQ